MNIKKIIKILLTVIHNPFISLYLLKEGCKNFCIGKGLTINGIRGIRYFHCGNNFYLGKDSRLLFVTEYQKFKYTPDIYIGNNVSIGNRFSCLSAAKIIIEDNCLLASDILITSENHGTEVEETDSYASTRLIAKEVHLGNGCWIGEKVSILPGVTLGDRCIVATNSVVTKSFPAYSMIAGIPAKLIKCYSFERHCWVDFKYKL